VCDSCVFRRVFLVISCAASCAAFNPSIGRILPRIQDVSYAQPIGCRSSSYRSSRPAVSNDFMKYDLDLTGKVALVCGVADASGYGWAIAKQLSNAGATVIVGTWPPVLKLFERGLKKGFGENSKLRDGSEMRIEKIYPLDAAFSNPSEIPEHVKANKRYASVENYDIQSCAEQVKKDYGKVDILVHSLANGPEVKKPLLDTTRGGYLAASSASAFSMVALVSAFGPLMPPGSSAMSLTAIASERVTPGYGGESLYLCMCMCVCMCVCVKGCGCGCCGCGCGCRVACAVCVVH